MVALPITELTTGRPARMPDLRVLPPSSPSMSIAPLPADLRASYVKTCAELHALIDLLTRAETAQHEQTNAIKRARYRVTKQQHAAATNEVDERTLAAFRAWSAQPRDGCMPLWEAFSALESVTGWEQEAESNASAAAGEHDDAIRALGGVMNE